MTFYDHFTVINSFIEAANHVPIGNETDESRGRKKRKLEFESASQVINHICISGIESYLQEVQQEAPQEAQQFCSRHTDITTISAEKALLLAECQTSETNNQILSCQSFAECQTSETNNQIANNPSFPLDTSCQLFADIG